MQYVLDLICEYYAENDLIEEDTVEEATIAEEDMFNFIWAAIRKEQMVEMDEYTLEAILDGEFDVSDITNIIRDIIKVDELKVDGTNNNIDVFRNRIMFPLHDPFGNVIGYNGRAYLEGKVGGLAVTAGRYYYKDFNDALRRNNIVKIINNF